MIVWLVVCICVYNGEANVCRIVLQYIGYERCNVRVRRWLYMAHMYMLALTTIYTTLLCSLLVHNAAGSGQNITIIILYYYAHIYCTFVYVCNQQQQNTYECNGERILQIGVDGDFGVYRDFEL